MGATRFVMELADRASVAILNLNAAGLSI